MTSLADFDKPKHSRIAQDVVYSRAETPGIESSTILMSSSDSKTRLAELRQGLEEVLAMISGDSSLVRLELEDPSFPIGAEDHATRDVTHAGMRTANRLSPGEERSCSAESSESDPLVDDALVVITEFGQVSPSILQMWLSIDYVRALRLLKALESKGLITAKGRVRHKAYELRKA